jgi:hypothetical protein
VCAIAARPALHFLRFGHRSSSYLLPRSSSRPRRKASFFSSAFCVPSGMERLRASTSFAPVENRAVVRGESGVASILQSAFDRFLRHQAGSFPHVLGPLR